MPAASGLLISLLMNSDSGKPGRFSHSGSHPAAGAVRSGGEAVEKRAEDDDDTDLVEGANAAADAVKAKQAVKMELVNRILNRYLQSSLRIRISIKGGEERTVFK
jgi:hypothetical protein